MCEIIFPKIHYFISKNCSKDWHLVSHQVDDYCMLFVQEGEAKYKINGFFHRLRKGDILF